MTIRTCPRVTRSTTHLWSSATSWTKVLAWSPHRWNVGATATTPGPGPSIHSGLRRPPALRSVASAFRVKEEWAGSPAPSGGPAASFSASRSPSFAWCWREGQEVVLAGPARRDPRRAAEPVRNHRAAHMGDARGHHCRRGCEDRGATAEGLSDAAVAAARLGDTAPAGRAVPLSDLARPG